MIAVEVKTIRTHILMLSSIVGDVSGLLVEKEMLLQSEKYCDDRKSKITNKLLLMVRSLIDISCLLSINLHQACVRKIMLNSLKYPVELCQVRTECSLRRWNLHH